MKQIEFNFSISGGCLDVSLYDKSIVQIPLSLIKDGTEYTPNSCLIKVDLPGVKKEIVF